MRRGIKTLHEGDAIPWNNLMGAVLNPDRIRNPVRILSDDNNP
jgi:hypothetical protein